MYWSNIRGYFAFFILLVCMCLCRVRPRPRPCAKHLSSRRASFPSLARGGTASTPQGVLLFPSLARGGTASTPQGVLLFPSLPGVARHPLPRGFTSFPPCRGWHGIYSPGGLATHSWSLHLGSQLHPLLHLDTALSSFILHIFPRLPYLPLLAFALFWGSQINLRRGSHTPKLLGR